ncbi:UNVERIFIED_CONTAM: hypothetical protein H355_008666 [Colinus virginianus]|nr:hypothetical protein H355_008666 [Colinus virginianus]
MQAALDAHIGELTDTIKLVQGELTPAMRQKVMCMITIDTHGRDIIDRLVQEKAEGAHAFQWQSQLKYYWREDKDDVQVQITDASFYYGYEYLGNGPRLVVTPLTDRIYVTATQALHLCMGCAPAGPAGTGKTETTKDLASAMGKACYVFNCSDQMDYQSMGNIFKVFQTGSVKASATIAVLRDPSGIVQMNPGYLGRSELPEGLKALFRPITVVVPDLELICENMLMAEGFVEAKRLARKFTRLYALCRDLLSKAAHYDWGLRAIKSVLVVAGTFKRAEPHLSEEALLMRALRDTNIAKIVADDLKIFSGKAKLKETPCVSADMALSRTLCLLNTHRVAGRLISKRGSSPPERPEIRGSDRGHLSRSGADTEPRVYLESRATAGAATHSSLRLRYGSSRFGKKQRVENSGPIAGSGRHSNHLGGHKSQSCYPKRALRVSRCGQIRLFLAARNVFREKGVCVEKCRCSRVALNFTSTVHPHSRKYMKLSTREWWDGLLSKTMRSLGQIQDVSPKWILLDGDLDANWIESMNSVMDDNKILTLASNERIPLRPHMRMIFEIRNLNFATPATVSRAGILFISDAGGHQWRSYAQSWVRSMKWSEDIKGQLLKLFEKYGPATLDYIQRHCKHSVPVVSISFITSFCSMLEGMLPEEPQALEYFFVFCFIWACGACLHEKDGVDYRRQFSNWWRNEWKTIKFPSKGTVFDYYVDQCPCKASNRSTAYCYLESWEVRGRRHSGADRLLYQIHIQARLESWEQLVPEADFDASAPAENVTIPTPETVSMMYFVKGLIRIHAPVMLVGLAGCGKTQLCKGMLRSLDKEVYANYNINFNFYTDAALLQTLLEHPLEKKAGRQYGPPGKLKLIYFLDDLNMPQLDPYNTQTAIELVRQHMDYQHWYDRTKLQPKEISNTQYLACLNPTAGSFVINPRLQRHFWPLSVPFPEQTSLFTIYNTFLSGYFEKKNFRKIVQEQISFIVKATLSLHSEVINAFRKTAVNFHYEFNMRHLSSVFQGLLAATPQAYQDPEKMVLMWLHECERTYGDRLVTPSDFTKYRGIVADLAKKMFGKFNITKCFSAKNPEPILFCHFARGFQDICEERINGRNTEVLGYSVTPAG